MKNERNETVVPAAEVVAKWIDDPHDIEQGQMLNPEWLKLHNLTTSEALAAPGAAIDARAQEAALQYPEALACLSSVLRAASHVVVTNGAQPKLDRLREVVSKASEWLAAEQAARASRSEAQPNP